MSTPYIGFSNDTLGRLPPAKAGDEITCPTCGAKHALEGHAMLLFYKCGAKSFLGGVNGRLTIGVKADVSGKVDL